jgi:hypothetical protein
VAKRDSPSRRLRAAIARAKRGRTGDPPPVPEFTAITIHLDRGPKAIAVAARNAKNARSVAFGYRSWRIRTRRNRYQKPIPKPVSETNTETTNSPVSETNTTGSGRKLIPLSIFRGGGGGSGGVYEGVQQPQNQPCRTDGAPPSPQSRRRRRHKQSVRISTPFDEH